MRRGSVGLFTQPSSHFISILLHLSFHFLKFKLFYFSFLLSHVLLALCRDTDTPPTRWKPVTYALWLYLAFRPLLMIWHPHPGTSRHAFRAHPSHCTCYSELIYLGFTTRCLEDFFPPLTASFGCRSVTVYFIYLVFGATFFYGQELRGTSLFTGR